MGLLAKIAVAVSLISFTVFVLFFGRIPALRNTPIGALHRFLWIHLPQRIRALDQQLTNGRLYASISRLVQHLMNDRHPTVLSVKFLSYLFLTLLYNRLASFGVLFMFCCKTLSSHCITRTATMGFAIASLISMDDLRFTLKRRPDTVGSRCLNFKHLCLSSNWIKFFQILFIALMAIPEMMFLPKVLPTLGLTMNVIVSIIVLSPYVFLYLSAAVDPGYVVKENLDVHGSLYPYDYALFVPGHMCKTCRQVKPARSKHCSLCGYCVSRADHHCIFINGCVGYGNHHWFLLLLFTTAVLTSAGAWLGGVYSLNYITSEFPAFTFRGSGLSWSQYFSFWSWALAEQPEVGSSALLCSLTAPLVWGLYLYSMYLVYRGMTTNESSKWSDFQLDIGDGYIFRRSLPGDRTLDRRMEPEVISWPKESNYYYARAFQEQLESTVDLPGEGQWKKGGREWTLADVDNIYDIGFVGNMIDVFLPRKYLAAYNGSDTTSPN